MDVASWLSNLGLGQYARAFAEHDVDMATLPLLSEADLAEIGVTSVGHRRRLVIALQALRARPPEDAPAAAEAPTPRPRPAPPADGPAEQRQLSVLYCQMVADPAPADAEALREVVRRFHDVCAEVVALYEGHEANFYGDCMLAYFGWPRAHEDDAERALRAGLVLVQRVQALPDGIAARVGIATGPVVVGDLIREGPAQQQSAVGFTPNLAARVLGLAQAGQVVVDELTGQLAGRGFALQSLGEHRLKGVAQPVGVQAVLGERAADSRFEARQAEALLPMVGRDHELALLVERWTRARNGEGQVVLLVGEAGIGKSRIAKALLDACEGQPHEPVRWQCSPYHTDSALWPPIQRVAQAAGVHAQDPPAQALQRLRAWVGGDEEVVALQAGLLGLEAALPPTAATMSSQALRERTLQWFTQELFDLAARAPLLLLVEDGHWLDPTTLELIERCLERIDHARMMILITTRPDRQPALAAHPSVTRLSLNRLGRKSVESIVARLGGDGLQAETLSSIVAQADGVPLFVEELTRAVLETGQAAIPASLYGSLMARLDRVPEVKEVAQVAACIGREFDLALLQAVVDRPAAVPGALQKLAAAELVFQRGERSRPAYTFKHALVQEAARESLLRSRRQAVHGRILDCLQRNDPPARPELLAYHAEQAGQSAVALACWKQAGDAAFAKSAYAEAIAGYDHAVQLFDACPPALWQPVRELEILVRLAQSRGAVHGFGSEAGMRTFQKALQRVDADREGSLRMAVLSNLQMSHFTRAELVASRQMGERLLDDAVRTGDDKLRMNAHRLVAPSLLAMGDFGAALHHLEQCFQLYDPARHGQVGTNLVVQPLVTANCYVGWCEYLLGRPEQGRQALLRAAELLHAGTAPPQVSAVATMHHHLGLVGMFLCDAARVRQSRDILEQLGTQYRMNILRSFARTFGAWVAKHEGRHEDAVRDYEAGLKAIEATGTRLWIPFHLRGLAESLGACGRHEEAMQVIGQALAQSEETAERWCAPELWRVRGELLLSGPAVDAAEAMRSFEQGLALARAQQATLWVSRIEASMATLPTAGPVKPA